MQKKKWSEKKFLSLAVFTVILFLVFFLVVLLQKSAVVQKVELTGGASSVQGTLTLCFDRAPNITNPGNQNAVAVVLFNLTINVTNSGCSSVSLSDNSSLFNITSAGLINFTPQESDVKTEAVNITASDAFLNSSITFNIAIASATPSGGGAQQEYGGGIRRRLKPQKISESEAKQEVSEEKEQLTEAPEVEKPLHAIAQKPIAKEAIKTNQSGGNNLLITVVLIAIFSALLLFSYLLSKK